MLNSLPTLQLDLMMFREGGAVEASLTGGSVEPRSWALMIAVVGVLAIVIAIADLLRRDRVGGHLTARLMAQAIGIDRRELRLLSTLARGAAFPSPCCLMISRGCFDRAVQKTRTQLDQSVIAHLRRRLFGESAEPVHSAHEPD